MRVDADTPPDALRTLQAWFQNAIFRPHEDSEEVRAGAGVAAGDVIKPSSTLTSDERVAIYAGMYMARLLECLEADFPSLRAFVGAADFDRFGRAYLAKYPSRSYTLNDLARNIVRFLDETPGWLDRQPVARDLAAIELAMSHVVDDEGVRALTLAELRAIPIERFEDVRLAAVPAFRLLSLSHCANALLTALRQEKPLPELDPLPTFVAVYRKEFTIWRMDLTRPMFELLRAIERGETLGEAMLAAYEAAGEPGERFTSEVFRWLVEFTEEGFFRRDGTVGA